MSVAHLHLLLNHVPVIGIIGVLLLLGIAFFRRSDELSRVALSFLVLLGVVTALVFVTGEPAEELVEDLAGVSTVSLERHEELAEIALLAMIGLALLATGVLFYFRRRVLPRWLTASAMAGALALSVVMGITSNQGGQIRHSEIRAAGGNATSASGDSGEREDREHR